MLVILAISSILLWIVVLFNLLISFQLIRLAVPDIWSQNTSTLKQGQAAPNFKGTDLDGRNITLSTFGGKQLLLMFISPSCSSCLERLDEIRSLSINVLDLQIVLVCDSNEHISQALAKEYHLEMPIIPSFRNQNAIWTNYKIAGTPYYCLIDQESRVERVGLFDAGWETLREMWILEAE